MELEKLAGSDEELHKIEVKKNLHESSRGAVFILQVVSLIYTLQ